MTEEELAREAYEWTEKNISVGISMYNPSIEMYCGKAYIEGAEPRERRIEELEKACEETQELLDKQIEATYKLDKENAELKKDKKELCHSISEGGKACVYLNEQLTKAKDHIKKLLDCLKQDTNDPQTNYYVCQYMDKAEQFLNSEVEK